MVATMEIDDLVDFVTGNAKKIGLGEISPEAWIKIIRSAVCGLDLKSMKGFQTITDILPHDPVSFGVPRTISTPLPRIWTGSPGSSEEIGHGKVFLVCMEHESFPREWKEAASWQNYLIPLHAEYLLLSREKRFYMLKTTWNPKVEWDERSMSSIPKSFSYHMNDNTREDFTICEGTDDLLLSWFPPDSHEQVSVLQRLYSACSETARHLRGQYDSMRSQEHTIQGYLSRLTNT